jgi:hypothetical protein
VKSLRLLPVFLFLYACGAEPPPPRSVDEFKSDRVILDATLARCNSKGSETDFEKRECNNANKAVEMLWRQREMELKAEREKQFDAKREALRLRQEREEALRRAHAAEQRARALDVYDGQVFAETAEGIDSNLSGGAAMGQDAASAELEWTDSAAGSADVTSQENANADQAPAGSADLEERIRRLEEELRKRRLENEPQQEASLEDSGS